jgi:GTPase SAR1 family protein
MKMTDINQAKENFDNFKVFYQKYQADDLTETDTRSKFLDELFKNVLGWEEININREKYVQGGYYDYLFSIPGFQFVVEAKKKLVEFSLPVKGKSVTLGIFYDSNKEVASQIRNYLIDLGLQIGVISNGHQFIIAKFINSDGNDWRKNKCIIFNGVNDIENRFIEFYNTLSKFTIIENGGIRFSEDKTKGQVILPTLTNKEEELVRNDLSSNLTPILNQVFSEIYQYEILDNRELIEECFVANEETKKNRADIERLFDDRPPKLGEVKPVKNTKNLAKQIEQELTNYQIGLQNVPPPKPIIIIGSKGAGKTTFINYLFKLSFSAEFLKKRPFVYIDFRKYVETDIKKITQIVSSDILEALYEHYPEFELHTKNILKRIYLKDIKRNNEGTWSDYVNTDSNKYNDLVNAFLDERRNDIENHFIKISEYLLWERKSRLSIVIDNADQFEMHIQRGAFLFAQSINRKAKCAVLIALREGYYYQWRNQPPFDAFASNVYHVTAPPYKEVLQKRIDYALKNLKIEGKTAGEVANIPNVEIPNDSVRDFLLSVKQSLFGDDNYKMLDFLEQTTFPNIREGLEVFKHFLLSGHTQVAEYILRQKINPDAPSPIPFWEFLKATALENKKYYNHKRSKVNNIFNPVEGSKSHFLKYKIIKYLSDRAYNLGYSEKLIPVNQLIEEFLLIGYKYNIILDELYDLLKYRMIETDDNASDRELFAKLEEQSICASQKGVYYTTVLICEFSYIDLVLQDTPIFDTDSYTKIRQAFPSDKGHDKRNLVKRRETVILFMDYLKKQEINENIENSERLNHIVRFIFDTGLQNQLDSIGRSIKNT